MTVDTLVLASQSPRRRQMLAELNIPFEVDVANIDEAKRQEETPEQYVLRNSLEKAVAVAKRTSLSSPVIIGADTVVVLEEKLLEKPSSVADAKNTLSMLSGSVHIVMSAFVIVNGEGLELDSHLAKTEVEFGQLSSKDISDYVASGEPMDKAGSYGIQGRAGRFVKRVSGSYTGVVGLPMSELTDSLRKLGFIG
ncbi:MAG: septum formation inhibitor Maf [Pseudobacteriovorax sp.]|nr:septum formation inhibitor Maf [Pseudobacteriovorax sp.]